MADDLEVRELGDEEWISQVGHKRADGTFSFQGRPRPLKEPPETDISFVLGQLGPSQARLTAFGSLTRMHPGRDAVRHVKVGTLRSAGFRVEHTPRRGSLDHVSVFYDGEWDDTTEDLLHSCCMEGSVLDG